MTSKQETKAYDSGRTGGQYSLFRVGLGLALVYLFADYMQPAPHPSLPPSPPLWSAGLGVLLALGFAIGWRATWCAWGLLVLWVGMALLADWRFPVLGGLLGLQLVYHLVISRGNPSPYGAWSVRGRADPGAGWNLPTYQTDRSWLILGVGLLLGAGFVKWVPLAEYGLDLYLDRVIQASCVLGLASIVGSYGLRALRPLVWVGLLGMLCYANFSDPLRGWDDQIGSIYSERGGEFSYLGPWMLLLLLLDPAWIKAKLAPKRELLFYDGECGLCHRVARFLLSEDTEGRAFSMAPLQGTTFESSVPADDRASLPDSIIIQTHDGRLLTNSSAIVHILLAMGGFWRIAGYVLALIPRPLRDAGYRFIASIRKRIFATPKSLCPMLPPHLAERFLP